MRKAEGGALWRVTIPCSALLLLVRLKNRIADAARARRSHSQKKQTNKSDLRLLRKAQGGTTEHPCANGAGTRSHGRAWPDRRR